MSFRKKNVVIGAGQAGGRIPDPSPSAPEKQQLAVGIRPSPLDGRPTTSTGTPSLDAILGGHSGLPTGTSLLVEEAGTTDFGTTLLRYYAAEGLVQGHHVHVLGPGEGWRHELPGLSNRAVSQPSASSTSPPQRSPAEERMRIAWRYEALQNRPPNLRGRNEDAKAETSDSMATFCHTYDLSKSLDHSTVKGKFYARPIACPTSLTPSPPDSRSPFKLFLQDVLAELKSASPSSIHRVVVPNLLSPTIYPATLCRPSEVLQFFHTLRALLRRYPNQLTAMLTLSTSLHPRTRGLTCWMEILSDGVLEMLPIPWQRNELSDSKDQEAVQGLLKVHSLPIETERGTGLGAGVDLSFRLSMSSGLVIKPYSLPPIAPTESTDSTRRDSSGSKLEF